jgi:hypothetical protein
MVTFDIFVKRFAGLRKFIEKRVQEIILKHGDEIVKMIVDQQLAGKGSDDRTMQSGYSKGYAKRRKNKGLQTRFVDLHFSGKMHGGMKVMAVPGGVDVRSKEPYEYYVRANFPTGFAPTKKNLKIIEEFVANILVVDIKKYLVG